MILTTILLLVSIVAIAIATCLLAAGGGVFIVLFADVILCVMVIVWLIKRSFKKRKNRWEKRGNETRISSFHLRCSARTEQAGSRPAEEEGTAGPYYEWGGK